MTPDDWFDLLLAQLAADADGPVSSRPATPSEDEIGALLDLARVAAHTSERWTAPISGFVVGAALAGLDPAERARRLRRLADDLEEDATTSS